MNYAYKGEYELAIEMLLLLYHNKIIRFNSKKYFEICENLMNNKKPNGYHEMFGCYAYSGLVKTNYKKAFDYLMLGMMNYAKSRLLIFNLGYCYEKGIGVEIDNERSHRYYEMIIDDNGCEIKITLK